jgi:hypothetical protein
MPVARTRLALALVSLAVIGLELVFMRMLSVRFWSHFAAMVVGVALLGFGASGTALALLARRVAGRERAWLGGAAMAFALSIPAAWAAARYVPVDVQFLAWDLWQVLHVAAMEAAMAVPFLAAGLAVGVALTDRPERLGGHYAATLIGSGAGAVATVLAMQVLTTGGLFVALTITGVAAGVVMLPGSRRCATAGLSGRAPAIGTDARPGKPAVAHNQAARLGAYVLAGAAAVAAALWLAGQPPAVSPYKMLAQARLWPGTETIAGREGPLGRIDVLAGPAVHYAPGLSLVCAERVPPHVLMITDGDQTSPVYDARRREDWAFLDYTTGAVAYHLRPQPRVCIVGAGGGADIGLALYHQSAAVTALEMNRQVIDLMIGPLAVHGGGVFRAAGVTVVNREARGYFASPGPAFDLVQVPPLEAFGAAGAGLYASQESYLLTVEAFGAMLDRLDAGGVLSVTRWVRTPPREELRVFDTAAQALRRRGEDPAGRLAMIRSWATATVLVFEQPIRAGEAEAVRDFCRRRSFDVSYLPGLEASETNRYHVVDRPYDFEGAQALLASRREAFLADYAFDVSAATDDRPYFFHLFRWRALPAMVEQLRGTSRAFLEVGYLMPAAGLAQAVVAAAALMLLPLALRGGGLRKAGGRAAALGYFLALGAGFMLLEMGFLQKWVLYLAHPIYSAAVVIGSFLTFAGLGSLWSRRWRLPPARVAAYAAAAVVGLSLVYLLAMDGWLRWTQGASLPLRCLVAVGTVAPLAAAMGHLFPAGLAQVKEAAPALVPWAWAVNGFASVVATMAAPLAAMEVGLSQLVLAAVVCYGIAGWLAGALPGAYMPECRRHE